MTKIDAFKALPMRERAILIMTYGSDLAHLMCTADNLLDDSFLEEHLPDFFIDKDQVNELRWKQLVRSVS